jgi:hypothetical protein
MKRAFVLVTALLIIAGAVPVYASGKVWSEVEGNTAMVHHDSAWFNCCADMSFEIKPHEDTSSIIDFYERDLGTNPCYCMCHFDFTHTLYGLAPGTYLARVWEASYEDPYTLAGSTSFTILAKEGAYNTTTYKSDCYETEGAEEPPSSENRHVKLENASSAPIETSAPIRYYLPADAEVRLEIYDVTGTKVRTLEVGNQEAGEHFVDWDIRDHSGVAVPRGIYFVRLEASGQTHSLKLIVLR